MTTSAAITSLPRCAATPECPTALEAAAAARFGDGIFAFGAFVTKAIGRHLARGARERAAVQQPVGVQPPSVSSAEAILEAEVEALKADAAAFWLREPAGIDRPQESASARGQLKAMLERCGGLERLDASIYGLLEHVRTRVTGGLLHNWFQIDSMAGLGDTQGSSSPECRVQTREKT